MTPPRCPVCDRPLELWQTRRTHLEWRWRHRRFVVHARTERSDPPYCPWCEHAGDEFNAMLGCDDA